ncbi:MAG: ArsB/NhaD family transporter [Chloroflexota bacterium]|nr:ArsB/NhaD family transporter [Chloroflexota bacterium]
MSAILAGAIFVAVYVLIVSERIDRTLAALLGAVAMIALRVLDQADAFAAIDLNVIFLLVGTMIIANIMAKTGVFQWLAVEAVRRSQGRPYRLLVATSLLTAVASMFLNNVTTVVLLTPVTFFVAERLRTSPTPFLISQVIASNIGGAATLIGDPPNILIGSAFHQDFGAFLLNVFPPMVVVTVAYLVQARWLFRRELAEAASTLDPDDIERLVQEERRIADPGLMRISLAVMGATLVGFVVSRPLGLGDATVAMAGAVALVALAREDLNAILKEVEWSTLFFFIGLFVIVAGVARSGIIAALAEQAIGLTGQNVAASTFIVLWMSAGLSAIVDNIPYTVTMIPLVQDLGRAMEATPLIWALSLGANLGGNATVIGASANIVVSNMSRSRGYPITFRGYLRYGIPATLLSMLICTVYVWLRYLVHQ